VIVVVLGMHKSGTTLVASMLHHAGVPMLDAGQEVVAYDAGGFYERASTHEVNLALLDALPDDALHVHPPANLEVAPALHAHMEGIVAGLDGLDWGFKDPRTALTYAAWEAVLPEHKVIAIYRPVHDLWPRFRETGLRRAPGNPARAVRLVRRWREHNAAILQVVGRAGADAIVLSYDALMTDREEVDRLAEFVGLPLPDLRRADLHRSTGRASRLVSAAQAFDRHLGADRDDLLTLLDAARTGAAVA
jgi:hypothetical protein